MDIHVSRYDSPQARALVQEYAAEHIQGYGNPGLSRSRTLVAPSSYLQARSDGEPERLAATVPGLVTTGRPGMALTALHRASANHASPTKTTSQTPSRGRPRRCWPRSPAREHRRIAILVDDSQAHRARARDRPVVTSPALMQLEG